MSSCKWRLSRASTVAEGWAKRSCVCLRDNRFVAGMADDGTHRQARRAHVVVRVRPSSVAQAALSIQQSGAISVPSCNLCFKFSQVFGEESRQCDVFDEIKPGVDAALRGENSTIATYGQTGSGKTHTMCGDDAAPGIVPRAFSLLSQEAVKDGTLRTHISVVDIYCERVRDLLRLEQCDLAVQWDEERGMHAAGCTMRRVTTFEDMMETLREGVANRAVRGTEMNSESSRSHLIVVVTLKRTTPDGGTIWSKLCLVDLAGSERQVKSKAEGASLSEGCAINKSLSVLSNVVSALGEGKDAHVPYRDSKLTRLLQDCLAGNARLALILCISPDAQQLSETVSTLRFGSRARGITNNVTANVKKARLDQGKDELLLEIQALKDTVERLQNESSVGTVSDVRPDCLATTGKPDQTTARRITLHAWEVTTCGVNLAACALLFSILLLTSTVQP